MKKLSEEELSPSRLEDILRACRIYGKTVAEAELLGYLGSQAAEIERLYNACVVTEHEVQQILGKALGYPWFKDDRKNFPDATEKDGVCVGDHVAATLAVEAANRIEALKALVGEMADNPWDSCEVGSLTCRFCGSYVLTGALVHTPDCPITRAQDLGVLPKEG